MTYPQADGSVGAAGAALLVINRPPSKHRSGLYMILIDEIPTITVGPEQSVATSLPPGEHLLAASIGAYQSTKLRVNLPPGARLAVDVAPSGYDQVARTLGRAPYLALSSSSPFVEEAFDDVSKPSRVAVFGIQSAPWRVIYSLAIAQSIALAFAIYGDIIGGELASVSGYIFGAIVLATFITCSVPWPDGFTTWESGYTIVPILGFLFAVARRRNRLRAPTLGLRD